MGQSSSRGVPASEPRSSPSPRPFSRRHTSQLDLDTHPPSPSPARSRNPFSRLQSWHSEANSSTSSSGVSRRRSRLTRAHTSISNILDRHHSSSRTRDRSHRRSSSHFSSSFWTRTPSPAADESSGTPAAPRLHVPDLNLDLDEFTETFDTAEPAQRPRVASPGTDDEREDSLRSANSILDRVTGSSGQDRSGGRIRGSVRRRRSPVQQNEDNAAMLSRLLSVAAAATAATLMGDDHRAGAEARNFVGEDEDGTFDGFLQSLQNGRIASALRGSAADMDENTENPGGPPAPLNFFRMFRFGSSNNNRRDARSTGVQGDSTDRETSRAEDESTEGRMIPIIIVGIRSINPSSGGSSQQDDNIPPFLDALSNFPTPITSGNDSSIDGILRQPQNGTRFSHRRRASMGGINTFPSTYDSQRHSRSPDRPRPRSTLSDAAVGPRPPPSTPASSGLSAFSSGRTTPTFTPPATTPTLPSPGPSRRESFARTPTRTSSGPESASEEHQPASPLRTARQRRLSESDHTRFGAGSARRNGVVEPDHAPGEGPRSWIIYVLGGSYPENHPILTTPSLFTDTPTYEDMMLLSTLLGPAKPPVASESDVASAGGLYTIQASAEGLIACRAEGSAEEAECIPISSEQRCLVCLSEYEVNEEARRLIKCGHLFHRECIDQWLTTGRNSCPLCRGQGVDEHEQRPNPSASSEVPTSAAPPEAA